MDSRLRGKDRKMKFARAHFFNKHQGAGHASRSIFYRERPPKSRAGNMKIAFTSSNTPTTAKPKSLKGSKTSQIIGNKSSTTSARGQQITNRMHQSRIVIISRIRTSGVRSCSVSRRDCHTPPQAGFAMTCFPFQ